MATLHTRPEHSFDLDNEYQAHHQLDTDHSGRQVARSNITTMSYLDANSPTPITKVITNKTTDEATKSVHMFALEIALLQYPIAHAKIDSNSKNRLMTIINVRRSQAMSQDPDLFTKVLDEKRSEWSVHWNTWSPWAVHPSFPGSANEEEDKEIKRAKAAAITRFVTEIIILEFYCVNAGLGDEAIKAVIRTVDRCYFLAKSIDAAWHEDILRRKRKEWMSHWLEWASFDELGRLEYGPVHGTEGGTEDTPANLMFGKTVMLIRTDDGQDVLLDAELLAEHVRADYEGLRMAILGGW
ncbi:uncharacterized protein N0V89_005144 [Didymosphaeria variabile]|uniref:Uncharacterized protein n=1 Tax=Didymosphaeria variabile TaxID=1932322 RepID=A0A9W8XMM7_9PLEO|nr:uncharacterized protein N0V89_005144 [Didymosphaeria variabile]KAJ4353415.1 hypothetical protein N0V89_005144 [Didymosphaeria variabile]